MTQNQIAFYKAQEERRHNLKTEGQTDTSIGESIRHNKASESINWYSAKTGAQVGFAQAAAAQAQAAAANKQADVAAQRTRYDYMLGVKSNDTAYRKMLKDNQVDWAKQNELARHNQKMEGYKETELLISGVTGAMSSFGNMASAYSRIYPLIP